MTAATPDDSHSHDDPVISSDRDHRGMLIAIMLEWLIAIVGIRTQITSAPSVRIEMPRASIYDPLLSTPVREIAA